MLIDNHDVIHESITLSKWHVVSETDEAIRGINDQFGAKPIAQNSNVGSN